MKLYISCSRLTIKGIRDNQSYQKILFFIYSKSIHNHRTENIFFNSIFYTLLYRDVAKISAIAYLHEQEGNTRTMEKLIQFPTLNCLVYYAIFHRQRNSLISLPLEYLLFV